MTKENLSDLTTEDLIKKKKNTNFVTGICIGAFAGALVMAIFLIIKDGTSFLLIFFPLVFLPIMFISNNMVKNIDKELKGRNSN